ncbi:MAG: von Willebrand factor type A domain-containing protein, partial [Planctomycetes bacterium]|nr:von Willebrand factor type A domain-containing protein [Planctomycetota bacterium]
PAALAARAGCPKPPEPAAQRAEPGPTPGPAAERPTQVAAPPPAGPRDPEPGGPAIEVPVVVLEEEVEVTADAPASTVPSSAANKALDAAEVEDAYGIGGGAGGGRQGVKGVGAGSRGGGAAGRPWAKGRLRVRGGGVAAQGNAGGPLPAGPPGQGGTSEATRAFVAPEGDARCSTFSVDVDTAAYANVRRFLSRRVLPEPALVRTEELINYFAYAYAPPADGAAFAVHTEVAACPWAPSHRLLRIALKGRVLEAAARPPCNLVFLVDVSGSMRQPNKLPLLQESLRLLVGELGELDRIALVTYAGASGLALPSTSCSERDTILAAIDALSAGGSTHGDAGIQLAYATAIQHFVEGGVNRVVLATDGDWNVGITDREALKERIAEKAKSGVSLSVLGFGGPSGDARMEALADRGDGNYASIDVLREAQKALVQDLQGTLVTIAKDVKLQVEFDPAQVASYRLIGYENRRLANADFADDQKDAGEIGAGHSVTAFYELIPSAEASPSAPLARVRLRHKQPTGDTSALSEHVVSDVGHGFAEASPEFRFAAAVATFGRLLQHPSEPSAARFPDVLEWAAPCVGEDRFGYRAEFLELVRAAQALSPEREAAASKQPADRG